MTDIAVHDILTTIEQHIENNTGRAEYPLVWGMFKVIDAHVARYGVQLADHEKLRYDHLFQKAKEEA